MSKNLILASSSTVFGTPYLEYVLPELKAHFRGIDELLFIPYARPGGITHKEYTSRVSGVFQKLGITVRGIHEYEDPAAAIEMAQGIFTGGGNTFLLVYMLYEWNLMPVLRQTLLNGTPYLGTSAGTNICGVTLQTTNDMPIIYPPSFKTLGLVPFNINPHYLDPIAHSTHLGESRETRIKEFHFINSIPVIGLREGSWLTVNDSTISVKGSHTTRVFEKEKLPYEIESGATINF